MRWALSLYEFSKNFPRETMYFVVEKQMIRCSSSSAANYHAVCRGKSIQDFIYKLRVVEEELSETIFCLKYTNGVDRKWITITKPFLIETNELLSIVVASIKTSQKSLIQSKS